MEDIAYSNEQAFSEIPVNLSIYGGYDQTGVHDSEGDPCPRVWDPRRKIWSDSWKEFLSPEELKLYEDMDETFNLRCSTDLKEPKTLLDIANHGIKNERLATSCIAEIMNQLYNQD